LNLSYSGGKLTKVTDAFNRSLTFNYSGELLTSVADSTGSSTGFAYDTNGDLVSFTDQENNVWQYGYDTGHRMTSLTNLLMAS
jgi:YD repeat-containing protein